GDVQPVLALALEVRALSHEVRLCVPPNFIEAARARGFTAHAVGVEMRAPRPGTARVAAPPSLPDLIRDQFDAIAAAAQGCDVILGANAHQYAARSVAELYGIPYVNALYAPTALPDEENTRAWNDRALQRVNENRVRLGLSPISDVLRHIVTERPWLATDAALCPLPWIPGLNILQTGAWILTDESPLSTSLNAFLDAGEPPVYLGFGSMPVSADTSHTLIGGARALGRRSILSRGWADLASIDDAADCIAVQDVNHQALFPRVAAVVHHGGAGTTLAAARAGAPQVVVPMFSDQPFWGSRVRALGIGTSVPIAELTPERLAHALGEVSTSEIAEAARSLSGRIAVDGAAAAARRLVRELE
ncbi:MAG TPA: glycosyltransferase, partial [Polyangiaceae bacterium]|nr:glycosyltransferase [Polyangiaceae bacterium]